MPIYFKNGLNGLKYPKRKLILGSTLIKYWNFKLFVSPNKCLHKTHFKHSVKGGYVVFFFQYVDDNNLVDFGFFLSFLVLWHFDKDYTDFGFFFHLEFEFKNPDFIYFLLGFACVDFSICVIFFIFFFRKSTFQW